MTALILTIALVAGLCYLVSWYLSFWIGVFMGLWILFSIGWFFRTWAVKGKDGQETLFDRIMISSALPVAMLFGVLHTLILKTARTRSHDS